MRATDTHLKAVDEQSIQNNICHGTDRYIAHTDECFSLGCDENVQSQGQLCKSSTKAIDVHIIYGKSNGFRACAKQEQNRPSEYQHDGSDQEGEKQEHPGAASKHLLCMTILAFSQKYRSFRSTTHTDQRSNGRNRQLYKCPGYRYGIQQRFRILPVSSSFPISFGSGSTKIDHFPPR